MNTLKILITLSISINFFLSGCVSSVATSTTSTAAPTEILIQVTDTVSMSDLKNGTYFIEGQPITLVNGVAENELAPGSASKQITRYFGNAIDIDLNSDGLLDTVFLLQQDNGGSGTFYYVTAALKTESGYVGTNAILLGDRIAPQSTDIDPNNPVQFIVNYADRNPGEAMSVQPTLGVSKTIKLENDSLVEVPATP